MGLDRLDRGLYFCGLCGACYGRGPDVPHNWREINPDPPPVRRCPSLEYFKFRTFSAMDRFSLATMMKHENYPISNDLKEVFYTCTMCGMCREICTIFDTVDLVRAVREEIVEKSTPPSAYQVLLNEFKEYGNPLRRPQAERDKWARNLSIKDITKERAENLFYVGCAVSLRPALRKMAESTANILTHAGVDFGILSSEEKCCGYIPRMVGDRELYEEYVASNIQLFNSLGIKRLITSCPGCLATFKSYPMEKIKFEVVHSVQYVDQLIKEGRLKSSKAIRAKVTYHDPCDLGRGSRVFTAPREIIKFIPGIELNEMDRHGRWSYCCGGGGGIGYAFPDYMNSTTEERVREAKETQAEILITACPQCYVTFQSAVTGDDRIRVEDILVLLAQSLS